MLRLPRASFLLELALYRSTRLLSVTTSPIVATARPFSSPRPPTRPPFFFLRFPLLSPAHQCRKPKIQTSVQVATDKRTTETDQGEEREEE